LIEVLVFFKKEISLQISTRMILCAPVCVYDGRALVPKAIAPQQASLATLIGDYGSDSEDEQRENTSDDNETQGDANNATTALGSHDASDDEDDDDGTNLLELQLQQVHSRIGHRDCSVTLRHI
jgi:hypothetical protein